MRQVHVKSVVWPCFLRGTKSAQRWYSHLNMKFQIARLDHIQIAAPPGCEAAAREFYGGLLGLREIPKPASLKSRGGCWFECGSQQLHTGVEPEFRPARKAHPAFAVTDLNDLRKTLLDRNIQVTEDSSLTGSHRLFVHDPWGNRLEFLESPSPDNSI